MTTTIPLGDDLVFQGPGTTAFRMRVNPDNGQFSILREDTATGETWVVDTTLRQNVPGFAFSRALIAEFFGLESNDPTLSGGVLDTSTFALCRHVPSRTPVPYDAIWAIVAVGDDNAGGVKNQQYGALTFRILNPTPDANGHAQGEARLSGNGFAQQGWMGISNGAVLTDANGQNPLGGYMGFGTFNVCRGYARRFEVQHITDSNNEGFRLHDDASGVNSHLSQDNGDVVFRQFSGSAWAERFRITKNKTIGIPETGGPTAIPGVTQIYSDGVHVKVMFGNGTVKTAV